MAETINNNNNNNNSNGHRKRKPIQDNAKQSETMPMELELNVDAIENQPASGSQPQSPSEPLSKSPAEPPSEAVPETAIGQTLRPRVRAKKQLRQSVIRRLCQMPSKRTMQVGNPNADAEVVYTNSQFGQVTHPCSRAACNSCELAPRRARKPRPTTIAKTSAKLSAKAKAKAKSKRSATAHKRNLLCKAKRQCSVASERRFVAKSLLNIAQASNLAEAEGTRLRQCLCTEVNGQVYKLMDLPNVVNDASAVQPPTQPPPLHDRPRLATKRKVARSPAHVRKANRN